MRGKHLIKSWTSTQSGAALSSGEAGYYGIVKGASVAFVMQAVLTDVDVDCSIVVKSDAIAAIAIASRRGLGKVRTQRSMPVAVTILGRRGDIKVLKVGTHENVADALTKYVSKDLMNRHMGSTNQFITSGRHALAPATDC